MAKVEYRTEPKRVAVMKPAPNAATGGKLYTALLKVAQHGPMGHLPINEGFYEVATFNTRSSAASTVTNIKQGKRKIPAGKWSFTSRGNVAANTSVLYAKYLGPDFSLKPKKKPTFHYE